MFKFFSFDTNSLMSSFTILFKSAPKDTVILLFTYDFKLLIGMVKPFLTIIKPVLNT